MLDTAELIEVRGLLIQLTFERPREVSLDVESPDHIKVNFEPEFFSFLFPAGTRSFQFAIESSNAAKTANILSVP